MSNAIKDAEDVVAHCEEIEGENRREAKIDTKFRAGEQWDEPWMGYEDRRRTKEPTITVNQLPQYLNQVINDIKQNRPSIKARPVDDKADIELADIYGGIFRNAQDQGKADMARDIGVDHAVTHGLGWYRVITDYTDAMSFDQELQYIGIDEPHNVYHNDFRMPDGSDLTDVVIVSSVSEAAYQAEYPKGALVSWGETQANVESSSILLAEHYSLKHRDDTLLMLEDGSILLESDAKKRMAAGMRLAPIMRERPTAIPYVQWRKLNGADELEKRSIEIPHIPVFPVVGMCMRVDGKPVRFGLIRAARDPQRYYNWLKSAEVEYLQNAPKSPWVGDARAFAPYADFWGNANRVNYAYLPVAGVDDAGNPIPPPQRNSPATIPSGLMQAELSATDDIKKSLGMYSAAIGARGNATSGVQEMAQQKEADVGTFHFSDNLAKTVLHEGRVLMSWVPRIYGRRQIARIIGIDDEPKTVRLTQALPQAVSKIRTSKGIEKVYNLGVGTYDVTVTVGPSYTTKRQEASAMMTEMVRADPTLMQKAGDIIVKNFDIPGAEALVERLRAFLPPQILQAEQDENEQNPEAMRMALAQVQQAQMAIQQRAEALKEIEGKMNEREREIERSTATLAQERMQLQADKQVLEARAREIEMSIERTAMKAAEQVRRAAESSQPASASGSGNELRAIQAEREALARDKREAGLEFELKMERAKQTLAASMPTEKDDDADEATEGKEGAEKPAQTPVSATAPAAPPVDLDPIKKALAMLLERPAVDVDAVRRMIQSEAAKTQKAVLKAIADSRTVRVVPVVDDDGNVTGGEVVTAGGEKRMVEVDA